MDSGRLLLDSQKMELTLRRLSQQIIEIGGDFSDICVVGIQPRGSLFAERICRRLEAAIQQPVKYGKLDITFYRDDFRTKNSPLKASVTEMNFLVENKRVILVDDVLYTGRTIQAAMSALQHYGRPSKVYLMTLVDRRFNRHLPIKADFIGIKVDSLDEAYVKVVWDNDGGHQHHVLLFPEKSKD